MLKSNRLIAVLGAMLLAAASLALAQLVGTWAGTGTGNCYPYPGVVIYPWSVWKGAVFESEDEDATLFEGDWYDELGNEGIFKGKIELSSVTVAVCKGKWFWYDPWGTAEPVYGGDFEMKFYKTVDPVYCEGTWTSIWPSPGLPGRMKGEKID